MRKLLIVSAGLVTTSLSIAAQDTTDFKRPAYKLTVAVDKKSFYSEEIKSGSFVLPDNTLQLYPGETVYLEMDQEGGVIKKIRAIPVIRDSAKTVSITFSQLLEKRVHTMMMLKVTNPFNLKLIYKAR